MWPEKKELKTLGSFPQERTGGWVAPKRLFQVQSRPRLLSPQAAIYTGPYRILSQHPRSAEGAGSRSPELLLRDHDYTSKTQTARRGQLGWRRLRGNLIFPSVCGRTFHSRASWGKRETPFHMIPVSVGLLVKGACPVTLCVQKVSMLS